MNLECPTGEKFVISPSSNDGPFVLESALCKYLNCLKQMSNAVKSMHNYNIDHLIFIGNVVKHNIYLSLGSRVPLIRNLK